MCDLFIRSYYRDFEWLRYCLASVGKYCAGFRAVVLVIPESSRPWLCRHPLDLSGVRLLTCRDYRDDYLGQQATKLQADRFTDADYVCHIDSDCIFWRRTTPDDLCAGAKVRVLMRPSAPLGRHYPWRLPTENFLGWDVGYDYMCHPPFTFPRWLYAAVRDHAVAVHGVDIESYLDAQPSRGFSEFNTLAAFAYRYHRERFTWIDVTAQAPAPPLCEWFWSWGGIDPDTRRRLEAILARPN